MMWSRHESGPNAWLKRQLLWGVLISVLLGVVSVATDAGGGRLRLGAVIAICGIALTLAIECLLRVEEGDAAQSRRLDQLAETQAGFRAALADFVAFSEAPPSCRAFVGDIADDWRRVDEHRSVFQGWILQDQIAEFQARLRELAAGRASLDQQTRHHFRSMPMYDFVESKSLSVENLGYWNTPRGRQYVENQRAAISTSGLAASRVLVISRDEIHFAEGIVRRQAVSGIRVSIILRDEVVPEDDKARLIEQAIVTDKGGVKGVFHLGGPEQPETFSIDAETISRAEYILEALGPYMHEATEIYPALLADEAVVPTPRSRGE